MRAERDDAGRGGKRDKRTRVRQAGDALVQIALGERLWERQERDAKGRGKVDLVGKLDARVILDDPDLQPTGGGG